MVLRQRIKRRTSVLTYLNTEAVTQGKNDWRHAGRKWLIIVETRREFVGFQRFQLGPQDLLSAVYVQNVRITLKTAERRPVIIEGRK